ncbi:MAG: glycosyltransferase family 2 protein [Bacteroidetes bacterium]|nr:glycosyltransferase family 2 protein [Bacteroidota bacterium]
MSLDTLVSVIVVTYNSSEFVRYTLESIAKQRYQSIELIITDDCSDDNTIYLCNQWLINNKDRFVRTEIIQSGKILEFRQIVIEGGKQQKGNG